MIKRNITIKTEPMTKEELRLLEIFLHQCEDDYFDMVQDAAMKEDNYGWSCEEVDTLQSSLTRFLESFDEAVKNMKEVE